MIFLSLKRLYPIAARDYKLGDFDYLEQHKKDFIALTNELLNRNASLATGTDGTISSAVAHGRTTTKTLFRRVRTMQARSYWP